MSNLDFARAQMGMSLAFHILFAATGIGLPVLMAAAEGVYLKRRNPLYLELARRLGQEAPRILFAVGAVSGTVLSFELGLLWPSIHPRHAGRNHRDDFIAGGIRILHRTNLSRNENLRLEPSLLSPVALTWLTGLLVAVSGILLRHLRGDRQQCMDEHAQGILK